MPISPSIFAYANGAKENTPLYLLRGTTIVELGSIKLTDDWEEFTERWTGRPVWVRRADCGSGCRCAAEYTFSDPGFLIKS